MNSDDEKLREVAFKKHKIISENLDRITDDFLVLFEETHGLKLSKKEKALFQNKSKSILYYWVGIIYDDATLQVKNLEIALEASKSITKKLRDSQQNLPAAFKIEPENSTKVEKKQDLSEKIDGFYSHFNKALLQKPPEK